MAARVLPVLRRMIAQDGYDFDLIDAHFYYPDGVAALLLGRWLGKPVVITARGSDLNFYPGRYPLIRRLIGWAARRAAASIAVSAALGKVLLELGAIPERVHVLPNGVDLEVFRPPANRDALRRNWGLEGPVLVSVGNLVGLKRHGLVIEALASLPGHLLLIAGDGPDRQALETLAGRFGVADRVRFLGRMAHEGLAELYGVADVLDPRVEPGRLAQRAARSHGLRDTRDRIERRRGSGNSDGAASRLAPARAQRDRDHRHCPRRADHPSIACGDANTCRAVLLV